jgi:hypothetical protein
MSPLELSTRPSPAKPRLSIVLLIAAAVIASVFVVVVARSVLSTPSYIDHITIANDTKYGVDVAVRFGDDSSRLLLGRALPQQESARHEVYDGGDRWTFVFTRGGVDAGHVTMTRDQLASAHWRVGVPASVSQRLAAAGQESFAGEGSR